MCLKLVVVFSRGVPSTVTSYGKFLKRGIHVLFLSSVLRYVLEREIYKLFISGYYVAGNVDVSRNDRVFCS